MKYYINNEIHKTGDTITLNGVKYFNCTEAWFKRRGAIEVVEVQEEGDSGLYAIDEEGNAVEPYTDQVVTHTETYTDEDGKEQSYEWTEPVAHKYFEYVGKPVVPEAYVPSTEEEILRLKARLAETDYCVIKIAEGVATKEEYADVLTERAELRKKINQLEEEDYEYV